MSLAVREPSAGRYFVDSPQSAWQPLPGQLVGLLDNLFPGRKSFAIVHSLDIGKIAVIFTLLF